MENYAGNDKLLVLIRSAEEGSDIDVEVSPSALKAFLAREADEAQLSEIRIALERSPRLRQELLFLMRYTEALDSGEVEEANLRFQIPERVRQAVLGKRGPVPVPVPSLWERMKGSLKVRILAPVAAAAAIILTIVTSFLAPSAPQWQLVRADVERAELIGLGTRGIQDQSFTTPGQAAMVGFRSVLALVEGEFILVSGDVRQDSLDSTRNLYLTLVDTASTVSRSFLARIPEDWDAEDDELTAWMLTLPSRRLSSARLSSDHTRIATPMSIDVTPLIVITFGLTGHYQVVVAIEQEPVQESGNGR